MAPLNQETFFDFQKEMFEILEECYGGDTTLNELRVMNSVIRASRDGLTAGVSLISECTGIPKSTVSRCVYNLVKKGRLIDEPHPEDRRRRVVKVDPETAAVIRLNVGRMLYTLTDEAA